MEATDPVGYVAAMGLVLRVQDGFTHGEIEVRPEMWAPGTDRLRMGILATVADIVAGSLPEQALTPTVDLRLQLLTRPPASGTVHAVCRPVRHGRRLYVGETWLDAGDPSNPFARATVTFLNQTFGAAPGFPRREETPLGAVSFDAIFRARFPRRGVAEIDPHPWICNGPGGPVQGGAQAYLAELAAERALRDAALAVADLDVRYLSRTGAAPLRATATVLAHDPSAAAVRVELVERGSEDRIAALVVLGYRRDPSGRSR